MSRKLRLVDPKTGRKLILYEQRTHKPPSVRREHRAPAARRQAPIAPYQRQQYDAPLYQHPQFYPYQQYARRSKALSWVIGIGGFWGSFCACEISPVWTLVGWGATLAILVYRSMKE